MRNVSPVEYLRAKIGVLATDLIEHFQWNVMQGGINCFGGIPHADRVSPMNYESSFS
jgi:hypothetical protein